MINRTKINSIKSNNDFKIFDFLNQSVPVLMGIFIFFNPFPHTTSIKEISFYLSLAIVLVLVIFRKTELILRTPMSLPFGLFVLWAFIGIFFALNKENTIHDFYSHLMRYVILYYLLVNFFKTERHLQILSWIIVISSSTFIMGGLFYYYLIFGKQLLARFGTGVFIQTPVNIIGVISTFAVILALNLLYNERQVYRKAFLTFCIITLLIGVLMTQTRSSLIGLFLAGVIIFIQKKKQLFLFTMVLLIIIVTTPFKNRFSYDTILNNERIPNYFIIFEVVKNYPIIGIGFGIETYGIDINLKAHEEKIPPRIKSIPAPTLTDPHNMVFDVAIRLGAVGLAFSLYIVFVFFKMTWKIIKYGNNKLLKKWARSVVAAFIAVSFIGLFQPIFSHMPEVVFCTIFSIATILWHLNGNVAKNINQRTLD